VNVDEKTLSEEFETHRAHLTGVAYRILGSPSEAEDAVQEAWLRVSRAGAQGVDNPRAWLTTIVSRVCFNTLQSRRSRPEETLPDDLGETRAGDVSGSDPEEEAILADSVAPALLVVLDLLTPAERLAFVLHDIFAMPFDEIAPILDRTPVATRQLGSRARRRVRGAKAGEDPDLARRRRVVDAFLAAARNGDFDRLLALLDPDAVLRADPAAVLAGAASEVRGARAVAETFSGRARVARLVQIDGQPGAVWSSGGRPRVAFDFTIECSRVLAVDLIADPARLAALDLAPYLD
jgi:RNA polymerase sigma factor (sigma-70 family)